MPVEMSKTLQCAALGACVLIALAATRAETQTSKSKTGGGQATTGILSPLTSSWAGSEDKERRSSLRGLSGVGVILQKPDAAAEKRSDDRYPDPEQVKTDVELRLRQAGIRILELDGLNKTKGQPFLYVTANPTLCSLDFFQNITLTRNPTISIRESTWSKTTLLPFDINKRRTATEVRAALADTVDKFINDYLAENERM